MQYWVGRGGLARESRQGSSLDGCRTLERWWEHASGGQPSWWVLDMTRLAVLLPHLAPVRGDGARGRGRGGEGGGGVRVRGPYCLPLWVFRDGNARDRKGSDSGGGCCCVKAESERGICVCSNQGEPSASGFRIDSPQGIGQGRCKVLPPQARRVCEYLPSSCNISYLHHV